jgi:hypothetical protein
MWRYLKAAFLMEMEIPGLGRLPVNALFAAGMGILGAAIHPLWLAEIGIETALVSTLAFHPRFQKYVDATSGDRALQDGSDDGNTKRNTLIAVLPDELRARLLKLEQTSARVLSIYQNLGIEPELLDGTKASLDKLQWIYLKLLIARHHLANELGAESRESIEARIEQLQPLHISAQAEPSTALQRSQEATLAILHRRLDNLRNRDRILRENDSDLARIEAQVELMRENAAIEGKPSSVETEIELASDLASPDLYGSQMSLIHELDAARR